MEINASNFALSSSQRRRSSCLLASSSRRLFSSSLRLVSSIHLSRHRMSGPCGGEGDLRSAPPASLGNTKFTDLVFADDAIIFAESVEVLAVALEALHEEAKPLGLEVSWLKTKVQVFGGLLDETVQSVHACGEDIEILETFTYLGSTVHNDGGSRQEVLRRIGIAHGIMDSLSTSIWRCRYLCSRTKIRIFKSLVIPVLLYGCETWTLNSDLKRRIDAFGLTFTIESSSDKSMPFLDVLVMQKEESFITNVYVKPTNTGHCLNGESECPQRYKDSTIGAYIRRALTHCSTWQLMHKEIERFTQVLINNGFSERDINRQTKKIMENWYNPNATKKSEDITIFYRAFFSTAHQEEERIISQIVNRYVKPADPERRIKLVMFAVSRFRA
ncbi:putative uncharacterized transposon-derived protein F52C9.6 [Chionoecetes opilio]|uniref:Uncharacterized transposon-derived protein F52C9.6 n=1 Tax=Chionoecetes opilio TaxID=41210 RepID=A0A8J4YAG2_CHIOP|nr:putative uncharacterized transposon-derived protein F52C9.6 [Chionoecetes opilio]